MKLTKLIVEIRYLEIPSPLRNREKIIEAVTGKKISQPRASFQENIVIEDKKNKFRTLISTNRTSFEINQPQSKSEAIGYCFKHFLRAEGVLGWQKIFRIGVRSLLLEKRNDSLENLIEKVKKAFYKDNSVCDEAVDVAVDFTLKDSEKKINFILGPMGKAQLMSDFLPPASFEAKDIPEVFLFLNYDYYFLKEIKYTNDFFKEFVSNALGLGEKKAKEAFGIVKK